MNQETWQENVDQLSALLSSVSFRDAEARELGADEGFAFWRDLTVKSRNDKRTIFLIGNGASASMASHIAADLAKNAHVHTEVFTDLSLITAISNDMGYECVFAEPLRRRARKGDMLVAISSSGESANVVAAVDAASQLNLKSVTLSAMGETNPLRSKGTLNIYVRANTYGHAETCHAAILHRWMDTVEIPHD